MGIRIVSTSVRNLTLKSHSASGEFTSNTATLVDSVPVVRSTATGKTGATFTDIRKMMLLK